MVVTQAQLGGAIRGVQLRRASLAWRALDEYNLLLQGAPNVLQRMAK
jgi:hypothetical protein